MIPIVVLVRVVTCDLIQEVVIGIIAAGEIFPWHDQMFCDPRALTPWKVALPLGLHQYIAAPGHGGIVRNDKMWNIRRIEILRCDVLFIHLQKKTGLDFYDVAFTVTIYFSLSLELKTAF